MNAPWRRWSQKEQTLDEDHHDVIDDGHGDDNVENESGTRENVDSKLSSDVQKTEAVNLFVANFAFIKCRLYIYWDNNIYNTETFRF